MLNIYDWIILILIALMVLLAVKNIRKKGGTCTCGCNECNRECSRNKKNNQEN